MHDQRYTVLLLVVLGAMLGLIQCSQQAKAPEGKVVISVNAGPKDWDKNEQAVWALQLRMFEEKHPDIQVRVETWDFSPEVFASRAAGNTLTDLVTTWATEGEAMITRHLMQDITPLMHEWEGYKELRPEVVRPFERDGRIYAFPVTAYSMALFYNTAMFREAGLVDSEGRATPPQTWEEFVDYAQRLTNRDKGVCGFAIMGENPRTGWHFLNWGWQAGGEFERYEDGKWRAVFDSPPIVQALEFIKDLHWKYDVVQADLLATYEDIWQLFASERAAMMIEPANETGMTYLRTKYQFDLNRLGIALLPAGPAGRAVQMGADYYIFKPGLSPEKQRAAMKWCLFCVSPEWWEARSRLRKEQDRVVGAPFIPIFSGPRASEIRAIFERHRNVPQFAEYEDEVVKYLKTEPPYYCQQLYSEVLSPAVQEVLTNERADAYTILHNFARMFQARFLDTVTAELTPVE